MTVFPSVPADDDLFAQLEARTARRSVAQAKATPDVGARLVAIRKQYPGLQPSVATALAQTTLDPSSPEIEKIAKAAAKTKSRSGLGWHSVGDVVSAGARLADKALGGVDEAVARTAKPVVRGTVLATQSLYEEAQGVVRNVAAISPEVAGAGVGAALGTIVPVGGNILGAAVGGAIGGALGGVVDAKDLVKGKARWEPQSSGAIALGRRLSGDKVELGSGWLPNTRIDTDKKDALGSIGAEQTARARNVTIAGHSLTPGRLLTAGVVQPGSGAYNVLSGLVDASLALSRYDPSSAVLKGAGNVNRNRKLFVEAGGLLSSRPAIVPEAAQAWLVGDKGRKVVEKLTQEGEFFNIWKATGGKLGAKLTNDLSEAKTTQEVMDLLSPHLGTEIRGKFGYDTFKPLSNVRLAATMPGTHFDPFDADSAVSTIERWMKNAKLPEAEVARVTKMAASADARTGRLGALNAAMEATKQALIIHGVDPTEASRLTRWEQTADEATRAFYKDALYDDVAVPGMFLDGQVSGTTNPHLPSEFLNRTITLPDLHDQRDIRMLTGKLAPLLNNGLVKEGTAAADFLQGQVWKRTALLRGAYTVRVIGEEQVRMAASGLDSMVNHPLSLLAMRIGEDSKLGRLIEKAGGTVGKGAADLEGEVFKYREADEFVHAMDEHNQALNRGFAGWVDTKVKPLPIWQKVVKGDPKFVDAWSSELLQLANDPVAREVARGVQSLDDVKQAFWDGSLANVRKVMAEDAGGLADRVVADRYIESALDRIRVKTGDDPSLIEAIGTGTHNGAALRNGVKASKEFKQSLAGLEDVAPDYVKGQMSITDRKAGAKLDQATSFMFSKLMGERTNNLSRSPAFKQFYGQRIEELVPWMNPEAQAGAVDWARSNGLGDVADRMEALAAKRGPMASAVEGPISAGDTPVKLVEGSPYKGIPEGHVRVFRGENPGEALGGGATQGRNWTPNHDFAAGFAGKNGKVYYADLSEDVVHGGRWGAPIEPAFGHSSLDEIRAEQRSGRVSEKTTAEYWESPEVQRGATGKGALGLEHIDTLAKGFALDNTKELLYDMTSKGQFFDAYRLVFPFGEAWKEMLGVWGKIGLERPQILARRAPEIITGLRAADPDGDGKGFFYTNENGEEVFAYPGAGWISEKLFGVKVPLTGRVAGLSLMTDVLPGVGPVVQMSAGALLPDAPEWDWAHKILLPFGETDTSGGIVEGFLPAWVQKFRQAGLTPFGKNESQWNGAVMDVARYLVSTGKYTMDSQEEINRTLDAAKEKAKYVYALRGAAQFFAPTAPTPEWLVHDKNGDAVVAQKLIGEYQDMLKVDPTHATENFLEKFGEQAFLLLQGKTAEVTPGAPITKEGAEWERSHGELVKSFPNVFGFFAPSGGDLDSQAFARQVEKGRRVPLTPEQAVKLANGRVANAIYQQAKEQLGPRLSSEQSAGLRILRKALMEKYPGYQDSAGVPEKASVEVLVADLVKAVDDPRLADNKIASATRQYLEGRQVAQQLAENAGLSSFTSAVAMAPARAALRALAIAIGDKEPGFLQVFDRVFDREMNDDIQEPTNGQV